MNERIVIVGGPRCGKSTLAREYLAKGIPVFCGDPASKAKDVEEGVEYLPEDLEWSTGSEYVATFWLSRPGPWVCEGQIMARALRKWVLLISREGEPLPCDRIIVFTDHHPEAVVSSGQASMHKGVMRVWGEVASFFSAISEERSWLAPPAAPAATPATAEKAARFYDSKNLIETLLDKASTRVKARFFQVVARLKAENTLDELATMLSAGNMEDALALLDAAAAQIASTVQTIYIGTGTKLLEELGDKLGVVISFDAVNARAVASMQVAKLDFMRDFTFQQREATRAALIRGVTEGLGPREQAKLFRDSIGLTRSQEAYVANYKRQLETLDSRAMLRRLRDRRFDKTVRRAIADGSPLSSKQIETMVGRYRDRWLSFRAEGIARTESLSSVHEGAQEGLRQAVESGSVEAGKIKRTWRSAGDDRVRDFEDGATTSHKTMNGQERGLEEPFESGAGNLLMIPGDRMAPPEERQRCRCAVATRVSL